MTISKERINALIDSIPNTMSFRGGAHEFARLLQVELAQQAPPRLSEVKLLMITTAYEQGVGKGIQRREHNPYAEGTDEHAAWAMGYEEGVEKPNPFQPMLDLLKEVSANFTRDDDLPDGLLGRIDALVSGAEKAEQILDTTVRKPGKKEPQV